MPHRRDTCRSHSLVSGEERGCASGQPPRPAPAGAGVLIQARPCARTGWLARRPLVAITTGYPWRRYRVPCQTSPCDRPASRVTTLGARWHRLTRPVRLYRPAGRYARCACTGLPAASASGRAASPKRIAPALRPARWCHVERGAVQVIRRAACRAVPPAPVRAARCHWSTRSRGPDRPPRRAWSARSLR